MSCILAPITFNFILLCLQLYCTYEGGRERIESEGEGKGEKQRGKERVSFYVRVYVGVSVKIDLLSGREIDGKLWYLILSVYLCS